MDLDNLIKKTEHPHSHFTSGNEYTGILFNCLSSCNVYYHTHHQLTCVAYINVAIWSMLFSYHIFIIAYISQSALCNYEYSLHPVIAFSWLDHSPIWWGFSKCFMLLFKHLIWLPCYYEHDLVGSIGMNQAPIMIFFSRFSVRWGFLRWGTQLSHLLTWCQRASTQRLPWLAAAPPASAVLLSWHAWATITSLFLKNRSTLVDWGQVTPFTTIVLTPRLSSQYFLYNVCCYASLMHLNSCHLCECYPLKGIVDHALVDQYGEHCIRSE